jgi:LPS-assembly lipoprotein
MSWSRRGIRLAGAALALAALSACGFHPLYAVNEDVGFDPGLAAIKVQPTADRVGQILDQQLRTELNPSGANLKPLYVLSVRLSITQTNLGLQRDNTTTHGQLTIVADVQLNRFGNPAIVLHQIVQRIASFDFPLDAYAASVAQDKARDDATEDLAREIAERLAIYLQRHPAPVRT